MPIYNSRLEAVLFSPQFDITKDLVITIDYFTNLATSSVPTGGFTIGLYSTSPSVSGLVGYSSINGLGYAPDNNTEASGISNGLLGILFNFPSGFYNSNSVNILDSASNNYNYLSSTPTLSSVCLYDSSLKRIRARITDFGNTIIVDSYNFTTNLYTNLIKLSYTCPYTAASVYIAYAVNSNQVMYISNINLNGMFTSTYIASSTYTPI